MPLDDDVEHIAGFQKSMTSIFLLSTELCLASGVHALCNDEPFAALLFGIASFSGFDLTHLFYRKATYEENLYRKAPTHYKKPYFRKKSLLFPF